MPNTNEILNNPIFYLKDEGNSSLTKYIKLDVAKAREHILLEAAYKWGMKDGSIDSRERIVKDIYNFADLIKL
jgi:hypothetical protein